MGRKGRKRCNEIENSRVTGDRKWSLVMRFFQICNNMYFYKNITGKYKYSEKYIKNDILY